MASGLLATGPELGEGVHERGHHWTEKGKDMTTQNFAPEHLEQIINPWKVLMKPTGQLGFINIYQMASGDRLQEEKIITEVAGYGRQLGRIIDVLGILVDDLDKQGKPLSDADKQAVRDFRDMTRRIEEVRGKPTERSVGAALQQLQSSDPKAFERVVKEAAKHLPPGRTENSRPLTNE